MAASLGEMSMTLFHRIMESFQQAGESSSTTAENDLALAKAVILIEVATYDEDYDQREQHCIRQLLQTEFGLTATEVDELLKQAEFYRKDHPDIFYSTRKINNTLSVEEKRTFMTQVWKVVLADGKVDYSEDVLTRKLIQLLHLDRIEWVRSRDQAKIELGEQSDNNQ
jgi:uncharacterized tellurite resistance protein B-like protein